MKPGDEPSGGKFVQVSLRNADFSLDSVQAHLQELTPIGPPENLPLGYVSAEHWVSAYWSRAATGLDDTKWRTPGRRHVAYRVSCPRCGKKLILVGLDRDHVHEGSDVGWFRTYRRVSVTWRGIYESLSEGQYLAEHRLDVRCPVPGCRGNVEWRVANIALALHELRAQLRDDPRPAVTLDYVP